MKHSKLLLSCTVISLLITPQTQAQNDAYHQAIKLAQTGQQFANKKNWRQACASYEQTLRIYPNYPAVRVALAQAYCEVAQQLSAADATAYYKRAAELDPLNQQAKTASASSSPGGKAGALDVKNNAVNKIDSMQLGTPSTATTPGDSSSTQSSSPHKLADAVPADFASLPAEDRIPIHKRSNRLMVNGEINGKSIEMQFDTGAEVTMIGVNHLKQMGIDTSTMKGDAAYIGGSGGGAIKTLIVPMTLKLGKTSRKIPIFVHPALPSPPLVGQSFLNGLQYEINNQLQVLILRKPALDGIVSNKPIDPRDRNVVPFTMQGKSIIVPVDVCGQTVSMIFDTGADGIAFPARVWRDLHLTTAKLIGVGSSIGVDGVRPAYGYNVERIDFGPVNLRDVTVMVSDPGPRQPLLGQKVLGGEKFIIDEKRKLIIFHR